MRTAPVPSSHANPVPACATSPEQLLLVHSTPELIVHGAAVVDSKPVLPSNCDVAPLLTVTDAVFALVLLPTLSVTVSVTL